ncbi:MAG: Mur ligase family protein [Candidatus Anstonellales archaeon]
MSSNNKFRFRYYENYNHWDEKRFVELLEQNTVKKSKISHLETLEALKNIGSPNEKIQSFHIAGTNGKGSVVSFITWALLETNLKVGTFISPHLVDYRERFLINGKLLDGNYVLKEFEQFLEYKFKNLTKFELMTAFAFYLFEKQKVDINVIETGMGGRLDATRVCNPIKTIITGISYDHTDYLGTSLEEIAYEKLHIGRENVEMIFNSRNENVRIVAKNFCRQRKIPLKFVDYSHKIVKHNLKHLSVEYFLEERNIELTTSMPGIYNIENLITSYFAISDFVNQNSIKKGFEKAFIPIRMQIENVNDKLIIIDAAHNHAGINSFVETVKNILNDNNKKIGLIFNFKYNKDYGKMAATLKELFELKKLEFICIPDFSKGLEEEKISQISKEFKSSQKFNNTKLLRFENISSAFKFLIADKNIEEIYITGSIYMIGDLFAEMLDKKITWNEQD